ncbi:MAG: leucine-rich repeat protein [Clostridia bacterium]|nr:leucine-rich repeat protein [Clostridia bacterium]
MKQAEAHIEDRTARRDDSRRRALLYRRIGAVVLVLMAVALFVYIFTLKLNSAVLMWGSAGVLLVIEALLLWVDLPVSKALQGFLGVLCICLLAYGFLDYNYELVDGRFVPKYAVQARIQVTDEYPQHFEQMVSLKTLDMRGSTVTDFAPIRALPSLERLDIRENYAFDQQEHDRLVEANPNVDIHWSVPVENKHFDSKAEYFDLSPFQLTTTQLRELITTYPNTVFDYQVPLYGVRYTTDTQALDLQGESPDPTVIDDALGLLPAIRTVDLRGQKANAQTVSMLSKAHPEVYFMFTCDVPGGEMTTEDAAVTVTGTYDDMLAYAAYIPYMPNLESIDATGIPLTDEQLDSLGDIASSGKLRYSLMVYDRGCSSLATDLNWDNIPFTGVEEVEKYLAKLPRLKRVSMCDCGLTEDEMGELFDAHPDIKFIWWLEFGHYRLRTDATAFTTALGDGNQYHYDDDTFACIRYCTDLMMLDLGHNRITSIENFTGLTKLKVLILADNRITDISQITCFPDLEYLELFLNDITDVTPVTELKKLQDFNIFHNPLYENHKVLRKMTWLKRLWIGGCRLSPQDVKDLQKALPDTEISTIGQSSTGRGWRKHSHYYTLKRMYEEGKYIPFDE